MKSEEIARLAGVSRSTVSRVVNNYSNVPEETKEKVMKVVEKYNYQPNTSARALAGKKSKTIGVFFIITGAKSGGARLFNNDYFAFYLDAIVDIANSNGYYVLVQTLVEDKDYEKLNHAFMQKRIDGGILIGTQDDSFTRIKIPGKEFPFIIFDYLSDEDEFKENDKLFIKKDNLYFFNMNERKPTWQLIKMLRDYGHDKIGFIQGNPSTKSARDRFAFFKEAMKHYQLVIHKEYIIGGDFNPRIVYEEMKKKIIKHEVATAYISANDYMAIAAMECLANYDYKIPDDVSFAGYDNTISGQLLANKLTTIAPRYYEMAREAVELIIREIHKTNSRTEQEETQDENVDRRKNQHKIIEFESKIISRDSISNCRIE